MKDAALTHTHNFCSKLKSWKFGFYISHRACVTSTAHSSVHWSTMKFAVLEWNCQVGEGNLNHSVEPCDFLMHQKARREEDFEWLALLVDKQMRVNCQIFHGRNIDGNWIYITYLHISIYADKGYMLGNPVTWRWKQVKWIHLRLFY